MKKYLEIRQKERHPTEYAVIGKGGCIGDIAPGEIFANRISFYPEENTEWTSECLRQVADKLDRLEATNEQ